MIRRYRQSPEFGGADFTTLDQPHRSVLAHDAQGDDRRMLDVHNLSPKSCTVPLQRTDCEPGCRLVDLLQDGQTELMPLRLRPSRTQRVNVSSSTPSRHR